MHQRLGGETFLPHKPVSLRRGKKPAFASFFLSLLSSIPGSDKNNTIPVPGTVAFFKARGLRTYFTSCCNTKWDEEEKRPAELPIPDALSNSASSSSFFASRRERGNYVMPPQFFKASVQYAPDAPDANSASSACTHREKKLQTSQFLLLSSNKLLRNTFLAPSNKVSGKNLSNRNAGKKSHVPVCRLSKR